MATPRPPTQTHMRTWRSLTPSFPGYTIMRYLASRIRRSPWPLRVALLLPLLTACATSTPPIPEHMTQPQPLEDARRIDPAGEPYYLGYQMGDSGVASALDDGQYTYVEFRQPPGTDLRCFDDNGTPLACERVDKVLAIAGVHRGILLRQGDKASYLAPNPRAQAQPPRQLARTADWASHAQARNNVMLKGPLMQALARSDALASKARQATGQKDGRPEVAAQHWRHVPFATGSAQLDGRKPAVARLLTRARQADSIHIDVLAGTGRKALLAQARVKALHRLLRAARIAEGKIRVHTRTVGEHGKTTSAIKEGRNATDAAEISVLLLKDGAPLGTPSGKDQEERTATLAARTFSTS